MTLLKDRLRDLLEKSGKSQTDLAIACGVKPPSVNAWFSGDTKSLKLHTALKAAAFFGVEVLWLTDGKLPKFRGDVHTATEPPADSYQTAMNLSNDEVTIVQAFRSFDDVSKRQWLLVARDELKTSRRQRKRAA